MQTNVKLKPEEKALILRGAEISGIGITTFFRVAALKESRRLILENQEVQSQ